ncbi:MAG: restriction endonuclease subunit S [Candidatus Binatia bacterium]|nr:restriction endonuclease subunit S [Candidatus Binatia bacterium]
MKAGWQKLPFDEAVADESGGNLKTPQSEFLDEGEFAVVDQGKELVSGYVNDRTRLCRSHLPVVVFGDHTRCLKFVDFPFCMGADGIKVLRPKVDADVKYLYHYLRQLRLHDGGYDRHFKYLKRAEVVLPPLAEQRRIAEVLDRAEALRAKRRATLAQLDSLTQSVFLDLFGDDGENSKGWPVRAVADYVREFQGGKSIESESGENVITRNRVLKVSAVTGMKFLAHESKPVPDNYEPPKEHFAKPGDLLFSRANTTELVGAVAYVNSTPPNVLLPDKLWRFVWREPAGIEPLFVWALFQTPTLRLEIGRRATGTSGSMKNISQEKVFGIRTILPPIDLQR